jgi:hypothetical protein
MMNEYKIKCIKCGRDVVIKANPDDMQKWKEGALLQRAMPYLTADEREIMVSRICGPCFDKMFG